MLEIIGTWFVRNFSHMKILVRLEQSQMNRKHEPILLKSETSLHNDSISDARSHYGSRLLKKFSQAPRHLKAPPHHESNTITILTNPFLYPDLISSLV